MAAVCRGANCFKKHIVTNISIVNLTADIRHQSKQQLDLSVHLTIDFLVEGSSSFQAKSWWALTKKSTIYHIQKWGCLSEQENTQLDNTDQKVYMREYVLPKCNWCQNKFVPTHRDCKRYAVILINAPELNILHNPYTKEKHIVS